MTEAPTACTSCGGPASGRHGLPTCNGDIVSADFRPEPGCGDLTGTQPCCEACHSLHDRGLIVVWDDLYSRPGFVGGEGI